MADAMLKKTGSESEDSTKKPARKSFKGEKTDRNEKPDRRDPSKKKSEKVSSPQNVNINDAAVKTAKTRNLSSSNMRESSVVNLDSVENEGQNVSKEVTLGDVMSVLQTMKSDQNKTDQRLNELSNKVNEMYDYENYDEDELLYDEGEGEPEPNDNYKQPVRNDCDDNYVDDENNNGPPAKKQKTTECSTSSSNTSKTTEGSTNSNEEKSLFKGISEKFKVKEKVDKPVDSELAEIVNGLFASGIPDNKLTELLKTIDRPENCQMLTKTRVNQLIWDLLSEYTRGEENRIQFKQGLVIKAAILLTKMLDKLDAFKKEHDDFPNEIIEMGTDALGFLGHFHRSTNLSRRDLHKSDLSPEYFHLCSSSVPYSDYLYGDDISKKVSDIDSVNKVGKKVGRGRGFGRFPRRMGRIGGRRGSVRGGRGRARGSLRGSSRDSNFYYNNDYAGQSNYNDFSGRSEFPKNFRRGFKRRRP